MTVCSIEGCEKKYEAKGYCKSHYNRFRKYGNPLATPIRKEYSNRKPRISYEASHKIMNNVEYKKCGWECDDWYPMTEEYFYKNKSSKLDGFQPYCKECTKKKYTKWRKDPNNKEKFSKNRQRMNAKESQKAHFDKANEKRKKEGYFNNYYHDNKDKFKGYRFDHMHKKHDITDEEWEFCKEYFSNSCAYCGITEEKAKKEYGHVLHMEHAINEGENDITNCLPACRKCNSQKWIRDFDEWYVESNKVFSTERFNKVIIWLQEDCFKIPSIL